MNILEIFLLLTSVSLDTFFAGISYGIEKIKISWINLIITSISSTIILLISIILGTIISNYFPISIAKEGSKYLLILIGAWKILSYLKSKILKKSTFKCKIGSIELMISIKKDPKKADLDSSKNLSYKETLILSLALSIDNFGIGLGIGLLNFSILSIGIVSLLTSCTLLLSGYLIGKLISKKISLDLSWLSGILLLFLANKK